MARNTVLWVMVLALGAGACAGGGAPAGPAGARSPAGPSDIAAREPGGASEELATGAQPSPPPASPSAGVAASRAEGEDSAPAERQRPGLGTSWGENRESRATSAPFEREEPASPMAVATFRYDDEPGVRAAASRGGGGSWMTSAQPVLGGQLVVRLLDAAGRPLPSVMAEGRQWVVGEDGGRYQIQVQNRTGNRVEVVATVDGLDVVDGQPGSFAKRGYVLAPFATLSIEGFRRSWDEVAAFRFGRTGESYAAQKGSARNVGVIGVALFAEAGSRWPWDGGEVDRRNDADPFPGRFADPPPRRR